jgi:hypothetical protein
MRGTSTLCFQFTATVLQVEIQQDKRVVRGAQQPRGKWEGGIGKEGDLRGKGRAKGIKGGGKGGKEDEERERWKREREKGGEKGSLRRAKERKGR